MSALTYAQRTAKTRGFLAGITRKMKTIEADFRRAGFYFEEIKGARWSAQCSKDGSVTADFLRVGSRGTTYDLELLCPILIKAGVHVFVDGTRIYAAPTVEALEAIRDRAD